MNNEWAQPSWRAAGLLLAFIVLSTANAAGYRYGASDLAFYGPAVMRELDPHLFPRDTPVIDAQARLTFMDEAVAAIARLTTERLPLLFFALYLVTLVLLAVGVAAVGRYFYRSGWAVAALLAAMTLRHAIADSGTNTLEGYFHPRQVAFACGVLALGAFLRGRMWAAAVAIAVAAMFHPTTTLWFGIWLGVAAFVSEHRWRMVVGIGVTIAAAAAVWVLTAGPLAGRLIVMDREWLAAISEKEYLFPLRWDPETWLLNLAYAPVILLVYRWRAAAGVLKPREIGLVAGGGALLIVFFVAVSLNAARVALAIQLQPARIFWMLDFFAVVYVVWAIAEGASGTVQRARITAVALLAVSVFRAAYVMHREFPERPLFEIAVPGDWGRVAAWARASPRTTGWLADPQHASRYGTSLRMAAARDVFVEAVKDAAIGMYDRAVALRTRDRVRALGDFPGLSAARARQLASEYDLDYLITEQQVALPLAFQSGSLRVYRLR